MKLANIIYNAELANIEIQVSHCRAISESSTALPANHTSDFTYQLYVFPQID